MIDLNWRAEFDKDTEPFVTKLVRCENASEDATERENEAIVFHADDDSLAFETKHGNVRVCWQVPDQFEGDVVLCTPAKGSVRRLFRNASRHNFLLLTERCDQMCAMCSQPPKASEDAWKFRFYPEVINLVRQGAAITITGGEPTLYKTELFDLLDNAFSSRPDLRFHILSNGQHFSIEDRERISKLQSKGKLSWGVPLYSHTAETHDLIVGKPGAFHKLIENLLFLGSIGANIELRTVLTKRNALDMPYLPKFIQSNLSFVGVWAIMALEPIGYARANHSELFFDHTIAPFPLENALDLSSLLGIAVRLYNFPRCTVRAPYRRYCERSISDWKNKYLDLCDRCDEKAICCGFFEWYKPKLHRKGVCPLIG